MKDNWIKPFQEKLGDYELPLPAAPGRVRRVVPLLAGLAAAAALALLLLLPTNRSSQAALDHQIAEARSFVSPSLTVLPGDIRMPRKAQPGVPSAAGTGTPATEDIPDTAPDAAFDAVPETAPIAAPEGPQREEKAEIEPVVYAQEQLHLLPEDPEPVHYASRVSTKLFAGNLSANNPKQQAINQDYQLLFASGIGNDMSSNYLLDTDNVKHAYSTNNPIQETINYLPMKAGLSVRYDFAPRLSVESGLSYSYHHSKQSIGGEITGNYYRSYQLHYLGIPLKLDYTFFQRKRFDAYLTFGGEAEILAFGRITEVDGVTVKPVAVKEHPLQFSLLGAAGAEYRMTPWMGLYAEPGIAWHFKPGGELPNYYREHPWSFDLRIGLRFSLN
jgi:hypothetical protein